MPSLTSLAQSRGRLYNIGGSKRCEAAYRCSQRDAVSVAQVAQLNQHPKGDWYDQDRDCFLCRKACWTLCQRGLARILPPRCAHPDIYNFRFLSCARVNHQIPAVHGSCYTCMVGVDADTLSNLEGYGRQLFLAAAF